MDTYRRGWRYFILTAILPALLIACGPTARSSTDLTVTPSPSAPEVALVDTPGELCQTATQLRLTVQTTASLPAEAPADWELQAPSGDIVDRGTWIVRDGPLLVPLPADPPLRPGQYTLSLTWQGEELAGYTFTLYPSAPILSDLAASLTPDGPPQSVLPPDLRVVYITYRYENACAGSPFWITVRDAGGEAVCSENGVLQAPQGSGDMVCYREDGAPLAPGSYRIEMTLTEEIRAEAGFAVDSPVAAASPTPQPSPTSAPVQCDDLFAAAAITSEGEPFLQVPLFDWYTEVVYAGARCRNLSQDTVWQSAWYLEGVKVREAQGRWSGASEGVVWDTLTGNPENPFLPPGAYTVTLTVAGEPLTTTFSVFDYALRETAEATATPVAAP